jgi:hypothetical protein
MVTFVDKLSSNYAFICLKRAAQLLLEDLLNNSIYTRIMDTTELALIDSLHDQIRPHGLTITNHNSIVFLNLTCIAKTSSLSKQGDSPSRRIHSVAAVSQPPQVCYKEHIKHVSPRHLNTQFFIIL